MENFKIEKKLLKTKLFAVLKKKYNDGDKFNVFQVDIQKIFTSNQHKFKKKKNYK